MLTDISSIVIDKQDPSGAIGRVYRVYKSEKTPTVFNNTHSINMQNIPSDSVSSGYNTVKKVVVNSVTGVPGVKGEAGTPGTPGLSAYQIWLNQGNTGTELEFLASLKANTKKEVLEKVWASLPNKLLERKVMSAPPTISVNAATSIPTSRYWPAVSRSGGTPDILRKTGGYFSYSRCHSDIKTNTSYVYSDNLTYSLSPSYLRQTFQVSIIHTGRYLEFVVFNGQAALKINGEYTTLTPYTISGAQRLYIDFGTSYRKRVDLLINDDSYFGGCYTGVNDTIIPADIRGPKTVVIGDSFFASTGTGKSIFGIAATLSDFLGWDDVISSGSGSTGYITNVSNTKANFLERIQRDLISQKPDIAIIAGSRNDAGQGYTKEQMLNQARQVYAAIRAGSPDTIIVTTSPTWSGGPSTFPSLLIPHRDAIKQASEEYGCIFIDWLEQPFNKAETPISGTLLANTAVGATTFTSNDWLGNRITVQIGTDRALIKSSSGVSPNTFTYTIDGAFQNAHIAGDTITQVGDSFLTGTGYVGNTKGYGNCDLIIGSDGVHPSDIYGSSEFAAFIAENIIKKLKAI